MSTRRSPFVIWTALLVGAVCAAPAQAEATEPVPPTAMAEPAAKETEPDLDEDDEGGAMELVYAINDWFPIILDPELEPEVQDSLIQLWITTALCGQCCGPLWIPMVWVGEDPGPEYFAKEVVWAIALEIFFVALGAATSAGGIGAIILTVNQVYFSPVSLINGYDRALKRERSRKAERTLSPKARRRAVAMAY